jgi:hypothetical protein
VAAVWQLRRDWWRTSICDTTGNVGKSEAGPWGREAGSELSEPGAGGPE